ncbi:MAG TPA: citryl-CoA lyase [Pseudolabrys sp.]|nr:citryl-CoA lyase [Pseudolabrys sp.]
MDPVKTHIATSDETSITVRGLDLVNDLMGKHSFTAVTYFLLRGRMPTPSQTTVLDACLVTLMEHGWTPTSIIARLAADSVPGQAQVGIAAGLLAIGDVFVGTMEGCGRILAEGIGKPDPQAYCREVVAAHRAERKALPGFGHPFHKPDDPRSPRLFAIARQAGMQGNYIALLQALSAELDRAAGRHLTINATGAIAALLLEIDLPPAVMRSIAVVSRSGGLAGHLAEEQQTHAARRIWQLAEEHIPYEEPKA